MMTEQDDEIQRIPCNGCGHLTRHKRLSVYRHEYPTQDISSDLVAFGYDETWEIFQCQGCDGIVARVRLDGPSFYDGPEELFYPERITSHHKKRHILGLPHRLADIHDGVIDAFNHDHLVLCVAGLRILIEGLCADRGVTKGPDAKGKTVKNLEGKINGLERIVPPRIVENMHALRFLGNAAVHELELPHKDDIELALTVVEDICYVVYDLDHRAKRLHDRAGRQEPRPRQPIVDDVSPAEPGGTDS
jgi:hypothetical protein